MRNKPKSHIVQIFNKNIYPFSNLTLFLKKKTLKACTRESSWVLKENIWLFCCWVVLSSWVKNFMFLSRNIYFSELLRLSFWAKCRHWHHPGQSGWTENGRDPRWERKERKTLPVFWRRISHWKGKTRNQT